MFPGLIRTITLSFSLTKRLQPTILQSQKAYSCRKKSRGRGLMQPLPSIEQPQFTTLSAFALRLVQAYTSWRDPRSGEDAFAYFRHSPRHTGDEHNLRATLIREYILPAFNYTPAQIEYESQERYDLVLWSQNQHDRRKIAIIETKSSSQRNLANI